MDEFNEFSEVNELNKILSKQNTKSYNKDDETDFEDEPYETPKKRSYKKHRSNTSQRETNVDFGHCSFIACKDIEINPSNLGETVDLDPIDFKDSNGRFLKINITLNNVCKNKKICLGCLLCDSTGEAIAFKTFTTTLSGKYNDTCGTLTQDFCFVFPESTICNNLKLKACIIANYI